MDNVLTIRNLSKRYGNIQAVNNVSFDVERQSIFGILGPNGSGKTTTLGMVLDVVQPDAGAYSWFGSTKHTNEIKRKVGAILETPNFYPYLTGYRNLKIVADIKGVPYSKIPEVLEKVDLFGRKDSKFKEYSLGMKQRLAIGSALLGDPDLLVLDEPTNGLDPEGIRQIRDLIKQIAAEGKTIILASHLLDEVEKVCTHVGILKAGNLLTYGNVNEILSEDVILEMSSDDVEFLKSIIESISGLKFLEAAKKNILVKVMDESLSAGVVNKLLHEKGVILSHLQTKKKSLEDQFLEIVKKK
ncbi:MAG: ABC transporter ATP-binding protein [Bacteroidetes bacterium]|nr:ABC transporter ATP-binding protein [Bacteroidota bacterium]